MSPAVAGGLGPGSRLENPGDVAPRVRTLDYRFEVWPGDELLAGPSCFIHSRRLGAGLRAAGLSGLSFGRARLSRSEAFLARHPDLLLPPFERLLPLGRVELKGRNVVAWSGEAVCESEAGELVLDEAALELLRRCRIPNARVVPLE